MPSINEYQKKQIFDLFPDDPGIREKLSRQITNYSQGKTLFNSLYSAIDWLSYIHPEHAREIIGLAYRVDPITAEFSHKRY